MNASSPASRPTLAGFDTTTPTSSRSACAATARIAGRPAFPVPHTTTRYFGTRYAMGRQPTEISLGPCQSGIFSHHWHHQLAPTRIRSFGCQQYEISAVFSR